MLLLTKKRVCEKGVQPSNRRPCVSLLISSLSLLYLMFIPSSSAYHPIMHFLSLRRDNFDILSLGLIRNSKFSLGLVFWLGLSDLFVNENT